MIIIDGSRKHYRANFHTHTTGSDGKRTPAEAMALYREAGYDVLAITDHRKLTVPDDVPEGLLTVPGIELDYLLPGQAVHLVGLGVDETAATQWDRGGTPQQGIDLIHSAGGVCVLAHPAWSMNDPAFMASLTGVEGVEIWNSASTLPTNAVRADSSSLLDTLWSNYPGTLLPVYANDDTHNYGAELCAGWNMVQADELTVPAVLSALREGRLYATQGPTFGLVEVEDGKVRVTCSPCSTIIFCSNSPWVSWRVISGEGLTEAEYTVTGRDRFVRVHLIDAEGRSAWSRPFAVSKA